jgi:tmRNA-binding protein
MANKRSKVTSHQKQTNNASEKPLDSIETLIAIRIFWKQARAKLHIYIPKKIP